MFGMFKKLMNWLDGPRLRDTYEDMLIQEAAEKVAQQQSKNEIVLNECPFTGAKAEPVNPQITDAVTQVAPVVEEEKPAPKPKRARTPKGKLKADDPATPEVNEAWEGGKAPAKKPRKPRAKKK